jgi:hypothetical protein
VKKIRIGILPPRVKVDGEYPYTDYVEEFVGPSTRRLSGPKICTNSERRPVRLEGTEEVDVTFDPEGSCVRFSREVRGFYHDPNVNLGDVLTSDVIEVKGYPIHVFELNLGIFGLVEE